MMLRSDKVMQSILCFPGLQLIRCSAAGKASRNTGVYSSSCSDTGSFGGFLFPVLLNTTCVIEENVN